MATQFTAITGRKRRSPLADIIRAEAPFAGEGARLKESRELSEKSINIGTQNLSLARERLGIQRKQAERAEKIQLAGTAISGAALTRSLLGKGGPTTIPAGTVRAPVVPAGTPSARFPLASPAAGPTATGGVNVFGGGAPPLGEELLFAEAPAGGTSVGTAVGTAGTGTGAGTAGVSVGSLVAPAVVGLGVGKIVAPVGEKIAEKIKEIPKEGLSVASGAAAGAAIGSIVPGVGTAIGAVVGGIAGFFGSLF